MDFVFVVCFHHGSESFFFFRHGDDSSTVASSGWIRDAPGRLAMVKPRNIPGEPPLPLGKDEGKINLIKYPGGSDYLKSAIQHAVTVGPRKVDPSYGVTFAERYRPPPGIRVWTPDVFTFYVASVPGMVCFFEVTFDNGLRFPLHPFMKGVLQHFNICPSQLGAFSTSSTREPEQAPSPVAEAPMVLSSPPPSEPGGEEKSLLGAAVEQPLVVMPTTVWNPPLESARSPPRRAAELKRKKPKPKVGEDEDSLLFNAKLAAGAVSSILKDSDLGRSKALPVDEPLALSFQGVTSVSL